MMEDGIYRAPPRTPREVAAAGDDEAEWTLGELLADILDRLERIESHLGWLPEEKS